MNKSCTNHVQIMNKSKEQIKNNQVGRVLVNSSEGTAGATVVNVGCTFFRR